MKFLPKDKTPHPLRKHRLLFQQKWYLEENVVEKRESILRDALINAKMVVASTEYKDIWGQCKDALEQVKPLRQPDNA